MNFMTYDMKLCVKKDWMSPSSFIIGYRFFNIISRIQNLEFSKATKNMQDEMHGHGLKKIYKEGQGQIKMENGKIRVGCRMQEEVIDYELALRSEDRSNIFS